jgi:hypothetical protein
MHVQEMSFNVPLLFFRLPSAPLSATNCGLHATLIRPHFVTVQRVEKTAAKDLATEFP